MEVRFIMLFHSEKVFVWMRERVASRLVAFSLTASKYRHCHGNPSYFGNVVSSYFKKDESLIQILLAREAEQAGICKAVSTVHRYLQVHW